MTRISSELLPACSRSLNWGDTFVMSRSFQSRYVADVIINDVIWQIEMKFKMTYIHVASLLPFLPFSLFAPHLDLFPPLPSLILHPSFPPSMLPPSLLPFQFPLPEVVVIHRDPSCHEDLQHLKNYILEVRICPLCS